MVNNPYLSVIIPAYNESKRIPLTLVDIDKHLSEAGYPYEILVINNGSTDDTIQVVERFSKMIPNLRVLDLDTSQFKVGNTKGFAVRFGMLEAKGKYRLFMDADNSTSIDHFDKMEPFFKEGYDVVICSRAHKESKLNPPQGLVKQILGKGGNLIIQALVVPGIWDTQCGFKCFSANAAQKIFSKQRTSSWGFDIEILALARRLHFKIKQIPVVWVNDALSHVKPSAYILTLVETARIRYWLWKGVYDLK